MALLDNPAGSVGDGRKTVTAASPEKIGSAVCSWVCIQAETDNTGEIVVGGSTVVAALATRRGLSLTKGDTITLPVNNLAAIYIDTTVSTDGVTFTYGIA